MFDCKEGPLLASLTMSVGQFLRLAAGQISPLYSLYSLHTFVFSVFSAHLCIPCKQNYGDKGRLGQCRAAGNRTQFHFIGKKRKRGWLEYLLLGVGWQLLMTLQQELLGKSETVATSSNSNHLHHTL